MKIALQEDITMEKSLFYDCLLRIVKQKELHYKRKLYLRNEIKKLPERIHSSLVKLFYRLGHVIGRKVFYFISIPFLLSCLCLTGFQQMVYEDNFEVLALPRKGPWVDEKIALQNAFPMTSKNFDPLRLVNFGRYVNVVIVSDEGSNLITEEHWEEIQRLDKALVQMDIEYEEEMLNFYSLCAKWKGRCFSPLPPFRPDDLSKGLFVFQKFTGDFFSGLNRSLTYLLGGIQYDQNGVINSTEAISLYYWLRSDHKTDIKRARKWEWKAIEVVTNFNSTLISPYAYASRSPSDELQITSDKMKPLLVVSVLIIVVFTAVSASMSDWVRSKILLSLLGIFSALLATGSAFGLAMYFGLPFIAMNHATIFLMLGIGIDDMFVILAAWRRTPIKDSVNDRMAATYSHACISVTITSLTNMLAFFIGSFTTIRSIEIFCLYSCLSALMTYLTFITFFGGCLAAFGYLERNQRHSLFFVKVLSKSESHSKSKWYRYFMSGGINPFNPSDKNDNEPHSGMVFVKDIWGGFISHPTVQRIIILLFFIYLASSIYGITKLELERDPNRMQMVDGRDQYFAIFDKYFREKSSPVQIVVNGEFDYSDPNFKQQLLQLHKDLESQEFVVKNTTISWIKDWYHFIESNDSLKVIMDREGSFIDYLRKKKDTEKSIYFNCDEIIEHFGSFDGLFREIDKIRKFEMSNILQLIEDIPCTWQDILRKLMTQKHFEAFRKDADILNIFSWLHHIVQKFDDHFETDIKFNSNFSRITASRFLIFVKDAKTEFVQKTLRNITNRYPNLRAKVFSHDRLVIDEITLVKSTTIATTISTTIVVLLISFIFIPNPFCSLWVAFSIVSIELGVIGFMALWKVHLDAVSMINLVMCVGFSVDFSAHISYAFMDVKTFSNKKRIEEALYTVGFPILLGGLSTILGIIPLCFSHSSVFLKFFKIVFLVISFGMLHALCFLPVFMSFIKINSGKNSVSPEDDSDSSSSCLIKNNSTDIFIQFCQRETLRKSMERKRHGFEGLQFHSILHSRSHYKEQFMALNANLLMEMFKDNLDNDIDCERY